MLWLYHFKGLVTLIYFTWIDFNLSAIYIISQSHFIFCFNRNAGRSVNQRNTSAILITLQVYILTLNNQQLIVEDIFILFKDVLRITIITVCSMYYGFYDIYFCFMNIHKRIRLLNDFPVFSKHIAD